MTMNIFFAFNTLPRQYNSSLYFFSSDQRLVCQCPVQPSRRRHEVPGWKTDCAYHWTVLYLPADLLYNARKSPCSCKQPSHHHDSITYNFEYHVRRWIFNLKAGDVITFRSAYANFRVFMNSIHTYFGAYLIWKSTNCCVAKSSFLLIKRFCCKQHGDCTTTLQV